MFDIFFRLSIPKGELPKTEMEAIISLAGNPNAFREALLKLNEEGRIVRFLERLEDYTQSYIPEVNIETIITGLMDTGDLFTEEESAFGGLDSPMRIRRVFRQLSRRLDTHEKRFMVFKNAVEKANRSLLTIVYEVSVLGQQHGKDGSKHNPPESELTVNAAQLKELERLACNKIEVWALDGRLANHKDLPYLLYRWREWDGPAKVDSYVKDMIKTDDGLVKFVTTFLSKVKSRGGGSYVERIQWRMPMKDISNFVDLEEIKPRIRSIFSSQAFRALDERKQLAIRTFIDTIDGKTKDPFNDS